MDWVYAVLIVVFVSVYGDITDTRPPCDTKQTQECKSK
jgi:hypothetical protein